MLTTKGCSFPPKSTATTSSRVPSAGQAELPGKPLVCSQAGSRSHTSADLLTRFGQGWSVPALPPVPERGRTLLENGP